MTQLSILIVDDNEADRFILNRLLLDTGKVSHIHEAPNGKEAINLITSEEKLSNTDFIFLDINMPVMGGYEFLEQYPEIQKEKSFNAQVIVMTPFSENPENVKNALAHESVAGSIVKMPDSPDQLSNLMDQARSECTSE